MEPGKINHLETDHAVAGCRTCSGDGWRTVAHPGGEQDVLCYCVRLAQQGCEDAHCRQMAGAAASMKPEIVNLTPHPIKMGDGTTFAPSGTVARVEMTEKDAGHVAGMPVITQAPGEVSDLPGYREGIYLLVSTQIRLACPGRADLLSPGRLIRDGEGRVCGCEALVANQPIGSAKEVEWSNRQGSRGRQARLALIGPDGIMRRFTGESIPGVAAVLGSTYRKDGKWSHTTYRIRLASGARSISYREGWGRGGDVEGLAASVGASPTASPKELAEALSVEPREVLRYVATEHPQDAEEWVRVARDACSLEDAPPESAEPEGLGAMTYALKKAGLV